MQSIDGQCGGLLVALLLVTFGFFPVRLENINWYAIDLTIHSLHGQFQMLFQRNRHKNKAFCVQFGLYDIVVVCAVALDTCCMLQFKHNELYVSTYIHTYICTLIGKTMLHVWLEYWATGHSHSHIHNYRHKYVCGVPLLL